MPTTSRPEPDGLPRTSVLVPRRYRVTRVQRETRDTQTVHLAPVDAPAAERFNAGQFNMVYVFGVGEVPMSITGSPARPDVLVHTTRGVGAVSRAICRLARGQMLGIRGPFGSSWPIAAAAGKDLLLMAGGVGLAPLRPVIYQILADRARYGRVSLLYGSRTPDLWLYRRELARWRAQDHVRVELTADRAPAGWRGAVGVVSTLLGRIPIDPSRTLAMVCGPEVMMRFTAKALEEAGLGRTDIHLSVERNMKCAVGLCGHCQLGRELVCRDGPIFRADRILPLIGVREL
jgi:NAD(P)H-flavin reductase